VIFLIMKFGSCFFSIFEAYSTNLKLGYIDVTYLMNVMINIYSTTYYRKHFSFMNIILKSYIIWTILVVFPVL